MIPFSLGTCWKCGDTQGPWSLCKHPKYTCNIWLCEKCEKELEEQLKNESNNV